MHNCTKSAAHNCCNDDQEHIVVNFVALNCCNFDRRMEEEVMDRYLANFDFIFLSETRTGFAHLTGSKLEGFTAINSNIESDPKQLVAKVGIMVIIRDELINRVKLEKGGSNQVVWLSLSNTAQETILVCGAVYLASESAPYNSYDMFDDIATDIAQFRTKYANARLCLMGDFNARTGRELDTFAEDDAWFEEHLGIEEIIAEEEANIVRASERANEDLAVNGNGRRLLNLCRENNLAIVNGRMAGDQKGAYTCYNRNGGKSAVDYALVTPDLLPQIHDFRVQEYNPMLSDTHCPITMSLKLRQVEVETDDEEEASISQTKFKWNEEIQCSYRNEFTDTDWAAWAQDLDSLKETPTQEGVDEFCNKMRDVLINKAEKAGAAKKHRSGKKAFKPQNYWFDTECSIARTQFLRLKQRVVRLPDIEKRIQIRAAARDYRRLIRRKKLEAERQLRKRMQSLRSSNSKEYWRLLKMAGKQNRREVRADDVDAFRDHFKRLSGAGDQSQSNVPLPDREDEEHSAFNREFTVEELKHISMANGKACGLDAIRNEYIRNCPDEYMEIIADFFNIILSTGLIPEEWCVAIIVPLFKKGDVRNPDNYRGISLLSCVCKLFTSALNARLTAYAEEEGLIGEEQAGFRSKYCTSDHIFSLHAIIELYKAASKKLYCAFVDYKKAFDMVDRTALWTKLVELGIGGRLMRVIMNLYQKAKAVVRVGGRLTESFPCNIGVRQGESLSPLLFALFIRDLNGYLATKYEGLVGLVDEITQAARNDDELEMYLNLFILLYADDTIIMAETADEMQKALNALHDYCQQWKLEVNLDKTKIVIFASRRVDDYPAFLLGHELVKVADEYLYLGVTFYRTGHFGRTIERQISQAARAFYSLLWRANQMNLSPDFIMDLYQKTVVPILTYGSEVWGFSDIDAMEVFHRKCIKTILGVGAATANHFAYGESGMEPLSVVISKKMANFWLKVARGKQSKIVSMLYLLLKRKHYSTNFVSDWIYEMHARMDELGLENVWRTEGVGLSTDMIEASIKSRVTVLNKERWKNLMRQSQSCETYKLYKHELKVDSYLSGSLPAKYARNVSRFRCRSNYLPASSFERFTQEEFRPTCPFCWSQRADEIHYMCRCPHFRDARERWCGSATLEERKFEELMLETSWSTAHLICDIVETFDIMYSLWK